MGGWIMVPRTAFGDNFLRQHYAKGARQLVLLGAGMDARAYRMTGMEQLRVFEVDQQTTFDVKEPLLETDELRVQQRSVVATEFSRPGQWGRDLEAAGACRDGAACELCFQFGWCSCHIRSRCTRTSRRV